MRKILLLLPLVFVILSASGYATNLTTCTTINAPGYYKLLNDVVVDGETTPQCLILSSDVIFDCDGHWINSSIPNGLQVGSLEASRINNVTIINCKLSTSIEPAASFENVGGLNVTNVGESAIYRINFNTVNANLTDVFGYLSITNSNVNVDETNKLVNSTEYPYLVQFSLTNANLTIENYNANAAYEGAFISCTTYCNVTAKNITIRTPNLDAFFTPSSANAYFYGDRINILGSNISTTSYRSGLYVFMNPASSSAYKFILKNSYINLSNWNQYAFIQASSSNLYNVTLDNVSVESYGAKMFVNLASNFYHLYIDGGKYHCNPADTSTYFISDNLADVVVKDATVSGCTYAFDLTNVTKLLVTHSKIVGNTYGIFVGPSKISGQTIKFYDNLFNNTYNHLFQSFPVSNDVYEFNTTLHDGINVLGGIHIGGNYWGSPDGAGYSDMCIDSDRDGICDDPYVIVNDSETGTFLADYLPLSKYQSQAVAPPQLPEVRILNPVSEVYYSAYVPIDVVVVYNESRYNITSNISVYVDGLPYGKCINCTEMHKTIYIGGGQHVFDVYVPYKLYENGTLVNSSVLHENSTFYIQYVPVQTQITNAPGGGGGAILSLVELSIRNSTYYTYQNECVNDYLIVDLQNAYDYCDADISISGLPSGVIKYPSEYTLKPGATYIPIVVCGAANPNEYAASVEVDGLCGSATGTISVVIKPKLAQLWDILMGPWGVVFLIAGLVLWSKYKEGR